MVNSEFTDFQRELNRALYARHRDCYNLQTTADRERVKFVRGVSCRVCRELNINRERPVRRAVNRVFFRAHRPAWHDRAAQTPALADLLVAETKEYLAKPMACLDKDAKQ